MNNTTISPIDISQKSNDYLNGPNDLPTNNVPNEPTYKPIDDLNRIQEGVYEAPPSIQEYPQPQSSVKFKHSLNLSLKASSKLFLNT